MEGFEGLIEAVAPLEICADRLTQIDMAPAAAEKVMVVNACRKVGLVLPGSVDAQQLLQEAVTCTTADQHSCGKSHGMLHLPTCKNNEMLVCVYVSVNKKELY
jgi:hypothetical protein